MNIIAIDIGNTNITIGLFIEDVEKAIEHIPGADTEKLSQVLENFWSQLPVSKASKENKKDAFIVTASVRPEWTKEIVKIAKENLGEKVLEIGVDKNIPLPMVVKVKDPAKVGVDRIMNAYAAYSVVGDSVVIADFGSAVTIDLVDSEGTFLGGTIMPGFDICAEALSSRTSALPKIEKVTSPKKPFGVDTKEAINNGLYYSAVGALETISRLYSEHCGTWAQTVVTGGNMEIVKGGCDFADSFVTNLVVKGIVLTFKKYLAEKN